MDTQTFWNFGLVVLFVLVGGVFAATEIALISLRESQLTAMERQSHRGARVAAVARNPNRFLAAVQIGVTVAGFFSAAYSGSTLAPDLAPHLEDLGLGEDVGCAGRRVGHDECSVHDPQSAAASGDCRTDARTHVLGAASAETTMPLDRRGPGASQARRQGTINPEVADRAAVKRACASAQFTTFHQAPM